MFSRNKQPPIKSLIAEGSRIEGNVAVLGAQHPGLFSLERPDDYAEKVLAAAQKVLAF